MEKFFAFLCIALLNLPATASERIEVNNKGEIRHVVVEDGGGWRSITEQETEALSRPGEEIPINLHRSGYEREGFFHTIPISTYTKVIVFADGKLQRREKTVKVRGERELAVYVISCLISVFFMLISNVMAWRGWKGLFLATLLVAIVFFFVPFINLFSPIILALFFPIAVILLIISSVGTDNKKLYVGYMAVYYVAMAIVLFI